MTQDNSYISKRFEFKYFLSPAEAAQIEFFLASKIGLTADNNSQNGGYYVNSLYFDTPQMTDYRDKDGSFLIRKKMRARMYEDCWHDQLQDVWLEVKHKRNMNIRKTRVKIDTDTWNAFIRDNDPLVLMRSAHLVSPEDQADLLHFAELYIMGNYRPVGVVRYRRKAYLAQFTSPVRITFDYDIEACRYEESQYPHSLTPVSRNATILEVKFNDKLPWWFNSLVSTFDISRTDFSKYRNSIAVMRGYQRIPINK